MSGQFDWKRLPKQWIAIGGGILVLGVVLSLRPGGLPPLLTTVAVSLGILLFATAAMVATYRFYKDFSTRP